jgi:DeoR family transcriptional regulator of aga operon
VKSERYAYSSAPERRDRIVQVVTDQGYCTVSELSRLLGVSEMTIRRDLGRLVKDERLRSFHGGAGAISPQEMMGRDYTARDQSMAAAKHAIAHKAVGVIREGEVIAIDAGTTATHLAEVLPREESLRIVTHSLSAITALAGATNFEIESLGGVLHFDSLSFGGPSTLTALSDLHIGTTFLAASSLSERGAFCGTGFDAITKRALIEVSDRVVLIVDSSKFEESAAVKICDWSRIDLMIVDDGISEADLHWLAKAPVDVLVA